MIHPAVTQLQSSSIRFELTKRLSTAEPFSREKQNILDTFLESRENFHGLLKFCENCQSFIPQKFHRLRYDTRYDHI